MKKKIIYREAFNKTIDGQPVSKWVYVKNNNYNIAYDEHNLFRQIKFYI